MLNRKDVMQKRKTIFLDIDGTILGHAGGVSKVLTGETQQEVLPGSLEKLDEWESKGYSIILTTARRESMRAFTVKQLDDAGIFYDQLVMGIGNGERIVINDQKPDGSSSARAFVVDRDRGLTDLEV